MDKFTQIEIILLFLTIGYGVTLGIGNTLGRVVSWLRTGKCTQSTTGQLLDTLFYASVGYLLYVYFV